MLFVVVVAVYTVAYTNIQYANLTLSLFVFAAALISLPLLWSPDLLTSGVLLRFVGLWGAVAFYWALLQIPFSCQQKYLLLNVICCAAIIQGGLAIWQLLGPAANNWMEFKAGTRPYGIFQQVNVLASFIATGWAIALFQLMQANTRYRVMIWMGVNVFLTLVLQMLQSRVGMFGAMAYLVLMAFVAHKKHDRLARSYLLIALAALFFIAANLLFQWLMTSGVTHAWLPALVHVDKTSSNHERFAILQATWLMIKQYPFSGWGYGTYEYVVNRFAVELLHHPFSQNVAHPHNEILFEWAEGGMPAMAGMLLFGVGGAVALRKANWETVALWGTLLPILAHTMTEYPLYQSTPHLLVLLLLLRLVGNGRRSILHPASGVIYYGFSAIALIGMVFLMTAFRAESVLTSFERSGMQDFSVARRLINPWAQYDRYHYDRATSLLMDYNRTHDPLLLDRYVRWGMTYLSHKNDVHVFNNLVAIDKVKPDDVLAVQLVNDWETLYQTRGVKLEISQPRVAGLWQTLRGGGPRLAF